MTSVKPIRGPRRYNCEFAFQVHLPMLRAERLAAQRGGVTLFANVGFALVSGEALIVTGANGSGKTTLLRMVAGTDTAALTANCTWQGEPVAAFDHALRAATLYIGHAAALKDEFTAEENLSSLAALHGAAPDRVRGARAHLKNGRSPPRRHPRTRAVAGSKTPRCAGAHEPRPAPLVGARRAGDGTRCIGRCDAGEASQCAPAPDKASQ